MTLDESNLPEFLTIGDVKRFLNLKASTWTTKKLYDRYGIEFFKMGKSFYIYRQKFMECFKTIMAEEHNE